MAGEILFESQGVLRYSRDSQGRPKLIVEVDTEISRYYRSLIPKSVWTRPPMFAAHVSVVRKEVPPLMEHWGKYEGKEVDFSYSNIVHSGKVYWWLNVFCVRLEEIRLELGLPVSSQYTKPPDGFSKCFHCTLANAKERP